MGGGVSCAGKPLLRSSAALTCILNERLSLRGSVGSVRSTNATAPSLFCLRGRLPPRTPGTNGSSEWPQPGPLEEHYATPQGVDEESRTIETGRRPLPRAGGGRPRPPDWRLGSVWTRSGALVSDSVRPRTCGRQMPALPCSPAPQKPPLRTNTGCQRTTSSQFRDRNGKIESKKTTKSIGERKRNHYTPTF